MKHGNNEPGDVDVSVSQQSDGAVIAELAKQAEALREVRSGRALAVPYAIVQTGHTVKACPELLSEKNRRTLQTIKSDLAFDEVPSFIAYVNRFKDERSRLFVLPQEHLFVGVLDYHPSMENRISAGKLDYPDMPEPCRHCPQLSLRKTPEAQAWLTIDKQWITQEDFVEFLNDHYFEIIEPEAASVLELARNLEVKNDVSFKGVQRSTDGGYNVKYEEESHTNQMHVPELLQVRFSLYEGSEHVDFAVRLHYRLRQGTLQFAIKFQRLEHTMREHLTSIRERIESETGLPVWSVRHGLQ
ncbi:MAG: DUF2303 family protein [Verrucomicrobiota bacterium]